MKLFITFCLLLVLILSIACAEPKSDYYDTLKEWENQRQLDQSDNYTKMIAELNNYINQKDLEIELITIENGDLENEVQQLKSQINALPTQQDISDLNHQIANINTALTNMTKDRADTERRFIALRAEYESYKDIMEYRWGTVLSVNNHSDPTTTTNLTPEKQTVFYEMWDLWYDTLEY